MAGPAAPGVPACLRTKAYSALTKQLDAALKAGAGEQADTLQLLLNRGLCLQQLGLYRKAAKVGRGRRRPCRAHVHAQLIRAARSPAYGAAERPGVASAALQRAPQRVRVPIHATSPACSPRGAGL